MKKDKVKKIIFLNGDFIFEDQAKISVLQPGILMGFGLFETMRYYHQRIVYFSQHIERLKRSSRLLDIKFLDTPGKLKKIIKKLIQVNYLKDASVRLSIFKKEQGCEVLIVAQQYQALPISAYKKGFSAGISCFLQNENSIFAQLKTTNRLLYELSFQEAKKQGFDEALLLNTRGFLTEGTRSNIFLVKRQTIFTPSLSCGCLEGITRRVMFDLAKKSKINLQEGNFTLEDLYKTDEAFLTNSLIGVMPLVYVEKQKINKGRAGEVTNYFLDKYNRLLKNAD